MPCGDSSSSMSIQLDSQEAFVSFEYGKITCGREITAETGYNNYCRGRSLEDILAHAYKDVVRELEVEDEESRFVLYLEWEALRAAIAQYLGKTDVAFDAERCQITAVDVDAQGIEIALVILPPKGLPKILPCNLADQADDAVET